MSVLGKAFDRVNYNIILQTLEYYNVCGTTPLVFFAPIFCRLRQKVGDDIVLRLSGVCHRAQFVSHISIIFEYDLSIFVLSKTV